MGLDMSAYATREVKADSQEIKSQEEIAYWRKHNRLQGWFQREWEKQNPHSTEPFNCNRLWLNEELLTELEHDICEDKLPKTEGFFFGTDSYEYEKSEREEMKSYDLAFIRKARKLMQQGKNVYYTCWW